MTEKCESCRRGFNGRNGNGYSPCGCKKVAVIGAKESGIKNLVNALCHALSSPPKKP
ncbi:hypothetical protein [Acinetobacter sp. ANC 5414]|uniref:hypothetical protein n=1 Tax=Acinetobacter sp. ANC 5414 TaxID=2731251 RepID=UPI00148FEF6D|nr:hypothetical protein [Acinetobacter sp. ANC 5414]NNH01629.1 hypothetical protein [Acinetobacter sp. ANC 5414]